jgi:hypothetical protein
MKKRKTGWGRFWIVLICVFVLMGGFYFRKQITSKLAAYASKASSVLPTAGNRHPSPWRRFRQAQVSQFAFAGRQSAANLTQGLGPTQLTEQHGDELSPTRETAGMPFRLMPTNRRVKTGSRNKLQHLRENATYFTQG